MLPRRTTRGSTARGDHEGPAASLSRINIENNVSDVALRPTCPEAARGSKDEDAPAGRTRKRAAATRHAPSIGAVFGDEENTDPSVSSCSTASSNRLNGRLPKRLALSDLSSGKPAPPPVEPQVLETDSAAASSCSLNKPNNSTAVPASTTSVSLSQLARSRRALAPIVAIEEQPAAANPALPSASASATTTQAKIEEESSGGGSQEEEEAAGGAEENEDLNSQASRGSGSQTSSAAAPRLASSPTGRRTVHTRLTPSFLTRYLPVAPLPPNLEDIDLRRERDPLYASAYASSNTAYLRALQWRDFCADFMDDRPDELKPNMRGVLINWIIEVVEELCMSSDVLHLSVAVVDRALMKMPFVLKELQLLGCAAMLVASKFEDVIAPPATDFISMTNHTYTKENLLEMECKVLTALEFRVLTATPKPFLRRFQRAARVTIREKAMSTYLLEMTLPSYFFAKFAPSLKAAGVMLYTRIVIAHVVRPRAAGSPSNAGGAELRTDVSSMRWSNLEAQLIWTPELAHYTGFLVEELSYVVYKIAELHAQASSVAIFSAVQRKFRKPEWEAVAALPCMPANALPPVSPNAIRLGGR